MATSISWERVLLNVDMEETLLDDSEIPRRYQEVENKSVPFAPDGLSFWLVGDDGVFALKQVQGELSGVVRVQINITNLAKRQPIPNGVWSIVPVLDGVAGLPATFNLQQAAVLPERSRAFLFDDNRQSYIVNFDLEEEDERPELLIRAFQFTRRAQKRNVNSVCKPQKRRAFSRHPLYDHALQAWYRMWYILTHHTGKRILFAAQQRTRLEGNLLRVRDRMLERGLDSTFQLYEWHDVTNRGRIARSYSRLRLIRLMARCDIVLIDDYCGTLDHLTPDPKTVLAQLWHAGYGFKAVGFSRFGRYGSPTLGCGHGKYTYAICGSQALKSVYAEVFGIEENAVLATGLPRIDEFVDPFHEKSVEQQFEADYPQFADKRIVLFAPTFRGRGKKDAYYDYSQIDFHRLYDWCGEDTVFLFRMHPFIEQAPPIPECFRNRLVDFSEYPSTNDLLYQANILITDYSSIVYEYSLLARPIIFFAYDEMSYQATRGFHGAYRDIAPGKVCNSFDELMCALEQQDYEIEKVVEYRDRYFQSIDGRATDRVIDSVILQIPRTDPVANPPGVGC